MSTTLRVSALCAGLLLAGCASKGPPMPTGDWHALNVGRWDFGGNAVTSPPPATPGQVAGLRR